MDNKAHPCQLCGHKSKGGIEIFGHNGVQLSMNLILLQHFSLEIIESENTLQVVCTKCWKITDEFHQLYCLVKDLISGLNIDKTTSSSLLPIPKTEPYNEQSNDQLDFINVEVKIEENSYDVFDENVNCPKSGEISSELTVKDERLYDENSTTSKLIENKEPLMKKRLTAKQLYQVEQDKEIKNSVGIVCELCNKRFEIFSDLRKHFQQIHNINGYMRCCKRKFRYPSELYGHIKNNHNQNPVRCPICTKTFSNNTHLKKHSKRHDPTVKKMQCPYCQKFLKTKSNLKKHIECTHLGKPTNFSCDICGKCFTSKCTITGHLLAIHVRKDSKMCDMCGKAYQSIIQLNKHRDRKHLGIQTPKVQCSVCGVWLVDKDGLRKHIRNHYVKEETCTICGKKAPHRNALRSHMKRVHSVNIFPCTMCEKKFKRQQSLTDHLSTHTGFYLYKCKYCPKEYKYESNLYKHRKDNHSVEIEEDVRRNLFTPFTRIKKINVENDHKLSPHSS